MQMLLAEACTQACGDRTYIAHFLLFALFRAFLAFWGFHTPSTDCVLNHVLQQLQLETTHKRVDLYTAGYNELNTVTG